MAAGLNWKAALGFGLFAFVAFIIMAAFFPALLLAMFFLLAAIGLLVFAPKTHPQVLVVVIILIALAAIFGFLQVGQQASLSLAGRLGA